MCGGTPAAPPEPGWHRGLSPRVRGNRSGTALRADPAGSIPACAGEPNSRCPSTRLTKVYPRVCGGTQRLRALNPTEQGLSPRVRGNPEMDSLPWQTVGSIPACAGEPRSVHTAPSILRVYPRVCGGTANALLARSAANGLSPRVRGNLAGVQQPVSQLGSIPACAGEPSVSVTPTKNSGVYPRVCGGTGGGGLGIGTTRGLSPRVRGNRPFARQPAQRARSIPACAGEPRFRTVGLSGYAVYPRVCGGTTPPGGAGYG